MLQCMSFWFSWTRLNVWDEQGELRYSEESGTGGPCPGISSGRLKILTLPGDACGKGQCSVTEWVASGEGNGEQLLLEAFVTVKKFH